MCSSPDRTFRWPHEAEPPALSLLPADTSVPLSDLTVGGLLRKIAAHVPDRTALIGIPDGGRAPRTWTYAGLLAEAERVATSIRERVGLGARVAIWAPSVPEWPLFEYAAALAGVTLVALNPVLRTNELVHALRLSEAQFLLYAERSRTYDMSAAVAEAASGLPHLDHTVSLADWASLSGGGRGPLPTDEEIAVAGVPAQIQFTSGTTGTPKAVVLSHRAVINVSRLTFKTLGVREGATVVTPLPMFHTAGCVISCLGPLWCAGTFALLERFDPKLLFDVLGQHPGAVLTSVPTVLTALNEVARQNPPLSLSAVLTGAAPVRAQLIAETEERFSTTVFNLYGQTELASVLTLTRPDDSAEEKTGTVGRPLPHVECKIVQPETGRTLPLGATGEICARGYQQMIAYYGDPEATARKVDEDRWLHTGDLGSMGTTGALRIEGRLADLIIRGGENIAPASIEEVLATVPGVRETVVLGMPDTVWGEVVAAVLQPTPGADISLKTVLALCEKKLSPYKIPVHWFLADHLPLTASGKIQKFRVRELVASGAFPRLSPLEGGAS